MDADKVLRVVIDPNRRHFRDGLHANDGQALAQLCEHIDVSRQVVSKHLSLLEAVNLVVTIWRGRSRTAPTSCALWSRLKRKSRSSALWG